MTQQTLMMLVYKRLKSENRWAEAEPIRNQLADEAHQNGLKGIEAQNYTYSKLALRFPPDNGSRPESVANENPPKDVKPAKQPQKQEKVENKPDLLPPLDGDFSVRGLSEIPANWQDLPANSTLSSEISWVQANRLRVVRETAGGVVVDLTRSMSPAPSWAALGWLETSIKTYAKFIDVASRATATDQNEQAETRRELQSIEEVRKLLASMI